MSVMEVLTLMLLIVAILTYENQNKKK